MTSILSMLSSVSPNLRPSKVEVECYVAVIASSEKRRRRQPRAQIRREAELHLWVSRWWASQHEGDAGHAAVAGR